MAWTSRRRGELPSNWNSLRRLVLERDRWICQIQGPGCSRTATDVDHIRRGDNHDPRNLQSLCAACHKAKTQRESAEAIRRRRELRLRPAEKHPGDISARTST